MSGYQLEYMEKSWSVLALLMIASHKKIVFFYIDIFGLAISEY